MQLIFQYYSWTIQATQGIVGRQYDNLAHSLVVQGPLPPLGIPSWRCKWIKLQNMQWQKKEVIPWNGQ